MKYIFGDKLSAILWHTCAMGQDGTYTLDLHCDEVTITGKWSIIPMYRGDTLTDQTLATFNVTGMTFDQSDDYYPIFDDGGISGEDE